VTSPQRRNDVHREASLTEEHKAPWQTPWTGGNMQSSEWTFASAL